MTNENIFKVRSLAGYKHFLSPKAWNPVTGVFNYVMVTMWFKNYDPSCQFHYWFDNDGVRWELSINSIPMNNENVFVDF